MDKKEKEIDYCQFMRDIEADPSAKVAPLTIRQFLKLRDHAIQCIECYRIVQEVSSSAPEKDMLDYMEEN